MTHRWSGWPGAYCMDCGSEDVMESALFCEDCRVPACPEDTFDQKLCPMHQAWADALAACPPTKEAIELLRSNFPELVRKP